MAVNFIKSFTKAFEPVKQHNIEQNDKLEAFINKKLNNLSKNLNKRFDEMNAVEEKHTKAIQRAVNKGADKVIKNKNKPKRSYKCSICRKSGHNIKACPQKQIKDAKNETEDIKKNLVIVNENLIVKDSKIEILTKDIEKTTIQRDDYKSVIQILGTNSNIVPYEKLLKITNDHAKPY
jgi:hypothetical protein